MFSVVLQALQNKNTHKRVWQLAVPMILSNLIVPIITISDSAIIGHLPHTFQLASVAAGASLYTALMWSMNFLRMGTTGLSAQALGRKDNLKLKQIVIQALILIPVMSVIIAVLSPIFSHLILNIMQPVDSKVHRLAQHYFSIRLIGIPATLSNYVIIGWLLGTQKTKSALIIFIIIGLLNILLDLLLVFGLHLGIAGAAMASVIAEWSGTLFGLGLILKNLNHNKSIVSWKNLQSWNNWKPLLTANRDLFVRSLILQIIFLSFTMQGTRLGTVVVASNALLLNGMILSAYILDGLAQSIETLCGHAIGVKDQQALNRYFIVASSWAVFMSIVFFIGFITGGHYFINLQTDIPEVRALANKFIPYLAVLPIIAVFSYLLDGLFIAAGKSKEMRNSMLLAVGLTTPFAWILLSQENQGLWLVFLLFLCLRTLTLGAHAYRISNERSWFSHDNIKQGLEQ